MSGCRENKWPRTTYPCVTPRKRQGKLLNSVYNLAQGGLTRPERVQKNWWAREYNYARHIIPYNTLTKFWQILQNLSKVFEQTFGRCGRINISDKSELTTIFGELWTIRARARRGKLLKQRIYSSSEMVCTTFIETLIYPKMPKRSCREQLVANERRKVLIVFGGSTVLSVFYASHQNYLLDHVN